LFHAAGLAALSLKTGAWIATHARIAAPLNFQLHSQPSAMPAPIAAPLLIARDLRRSFLIGKRSIEVLRGVNVELHVGEAVFLCGASGAGKTTLLYTLAGLERPDEGFVEFEGRRLYQSGNAEAKVRNQRIGFVFQGYYLLPELTALENVMLTTMIGGHPDHNAAAQALANVGLGDRLNHLPAELSGGEQQRVAIARALINNPSIIFADEPTGNLDAKTGGGIIDLLLGLVREQHKTLVVVTHDAQLATRGDRRLEMRDGLIAT
jgi:putative ABC transport system ATP-binding protein/lipoprotein-releasing system ATP-binding protein